jgi:hypothetical protein
MDRAQVDQEGSLPRPSRRNRGEACQR